MDYADAREAFFQPRDAQVLSLDWDSPARRLRDAMEPLATVCFWSEPAYEAYAARGLDFLSGYVWGRASALGEPDPAVAASSFGVFEPGLVADVYAQGRAACSLADIRAAKVEGVTASLTTVLGDSGEASGLEETTRALREAAERVSATGRPFFAALRAAEAPAGGWAALWHACTTLRELRGDAHLAVLSVEGLDGVQANVLTERWIGWEPLAYTGSRAWSPEAMEAATEALRDRGWVDGDGLTDTGREARERIESATDAALDPVVTALGSDLDAHVERLAGWAEQVVAHGWFPPDPYKRAAG